MSLKLNSTLRILLDRRYSWSIWITMSLAFLSSSGIYYVVNDYKSLMVDYAKEKTEFMGLVIEQDILIDVLLADTAALKIKTLNYLKQESTLNELAIYNLEEEKITGNLDHAIDTNQRFSYQVYYEESLFICNQTLMSPNSINKIGYIQYSFSISNITKTINQLILKLILIAFLAITIINIMLLWIIKEIKLKTDNEVKSKIDAELNIQKNILQKSFLANMSHELRTPLNAISGFSKLLENEVNSKKGNEWLKLIKEASSNMVFLVNDILDFSKIESNEMEFECESFDFNDLFITVCKTLEPRVNDTTYFNYNDRENEEIIVLGDYNRIKQIMTNLISNAIKYTDQGEVVALYKAQEKSSEYKIYFEVKDTGIGIPNEKKPYIFDPFKQAHENKDRNIVGTGLGLSIVKELVNRMDGQIGFNSEHNIGSTFYLTLTLSKGDQTNFKSSTNFSSITYNISTDITILVAEDNEINQLIIKKILLAEGAQIKLVDNGQKCVDALTEKSEYDLVLMDIQMPEMDGIEATKIIRRSLNQSIANIPIVALTANVMKEDVDLYMEIGMNDHIGKPIELDKLKIVVKRTLNGETA